MGHTPGESSRSGASTVNSVSFRMFRVQARRRRLAVTVFIALLLLTVSSCSRFGGSSQAKATNFNMVTYVGDGVLPDGQSAFSKVLDLNKPIVLNFWGGDCPPCRAEMPDFQAVANQYQGQVIFLGIDVGPFTALGSHDSARQLLKDLNITYPTAYAVDDTPVRDYNLQGVPTTVLITRNHTISKTKTGLMTKSELLSNVKSLISN